MVPSPVVVAPLPWGVGPALHRGLAAALPGGTRVAMPGAGEGFDGAVRSIDAVVRDEGWERAVVLGHSMASLVALSFALRHPARVAALVLVGGVSGPGYLRAGLWRAGHPLHPPYLAALQRLRAGGDVRDYVAALLRLSLHRDGAWPALARDLEGAAVDRARMDRFFKDEAPRIDLGSRLAAIAAPALVVVGDDDPLCVPAQSEALAAGLPRARLARIAACGHFPWHEQPGAFRAALASFLGEA